MRKKMLYILNVANRVNNFSHTSILAARACHIDYHIAGNWGYASHEARNRDEEAYGIHIHQIDFERNPLHPRNLTAYQQLLSLVRRERFDCIHCNTPVGGAAGRLAGKRCGTETVIYQAHGFHFYRGAPLVNRLVYYPVERWLARYTDVLITINREDYEAAAGLRLRGRVHFVHGVGLETGEFLPSGADGGAKRLELGLACDDVALISMGDLVQRKNYRTAIQAISETRSPKIHYFICGQGPEKDRLTRLSKKLGVENRIHFLGFRSDIRELLAAADIFLFTTLQEGLPRAMMEAMASGLPCIASRIRGNTDLIADGKGGYLCDPRDAAAFAAAIEKLARNAGLRKSMGERNLLSIKGYDAAIVKQELKEIYEETLGLADGG